MSRIEVSAPGKTILHGEHAVVYGKAAIAISLDLRTHVALQLGGDNKIKLNLPCLGIDIGWDVADIEKIPFFFSDNNTEQDDDVSDDILLPSDKYLEAIMERLNLPEDTSENKRQAILAFIYLFVSIFRKSHGPLQAVQVTVTSEIPLSAGLGSSASYSVCLAAALLTATCCIKLPLTMADRALINKWAYQAEKILHGRPSGIDNSVCTYGGALLFKNGKIADMLPHTIPQMKVLLVNTKVARNTKALVAGVKSKREKYPAVMDAIMTAIDCISSHCWQLLQVSRIQLAAEDMAVFQDLVTMNQHLLNCLGVGHPKLDKIFEQAHLHQLPAKLTGAGGGGCALIILPYCDDESTKQKIENLKEKFTEFGLDSWVAVLGSPGVIVK